MHVAALIVISVIGLNSVARANHKKDFENALTTLDKVVYVTTLSAKNFAREKYDFAIEAEDIAEIYHESLKVLESISMEIIQQLQNEECKDTTEIEKLKTSSSQELSTTFGTFVYNIKLLERGVWKDCDDLSNIVQNLEDRFKDCLSSSCERDVIDDVQKETRNFPTKIDKVKAEYESRLSTYVAGFIEDEKHIWQKFSDDIQEIVIKAQKCEKNPI